MAEEVSVKKKALTKKQANEEAKRLTEEILDTILSLASLDFSKSVQVSYQDSNFNAVAVGLNMLGQELKRSVVSKEYVQNIISSMTDCVIVLDEKGNIRTANEYTYRLLGYEEGSLLAQPIQQIAGDALFLQKLSEEMRELDVEFKTHDGRKIPMQVNGSVMRDNMGNVTGNVLVARDMTEILSLIAARERANAELQEARDHLEQQVIERTKDLSVANEQLYQEIEERKRAEAEARAREQKYRNIFEATAVSLWEIDISELTNYLGSLVVSGVTDLKNYFGQHLDEVKKCIELVKVVNVNDASVKMFEAQSKEELIARRHEIISLETLVSLGEALTAQMMGQSTIGIENVAKTLKGRRINTLFQLRPSGQGPEHASIVLVSVIDLTETRELEDQLRQSQKMDAIGRLAGGVAHDFNNLLTVILNYGQMVAEEVKPEDPIGKKISAILECSERAAALTKQLLAFSRKQTIEPKILNLNEVVQTMEKMLKRLLGEDVELVTHLDPGIGRIKADAGQLEQVLMNLAVNSRDAMPKGGKLLIETYNVDLDREDKAHPTVAPGHYVTFAVTDTGEGMTEQVKTRIFEPFFTTKGVGKGTGLGLATVYGNIKQANGFIWVSSEVGRGTSFKIYLPRNYEVDAEDAKKEVAPASLQGTETIMVVEDEDRVRNVACALLKKNGYQILEARNGGEAILIAEQHKGKIDMMLTDVIMPNMNGRVLADRLKSVRPDMRVMFMSGYTDDAITQNGILKPGTSFLQKPFVPKVLLGKVREVLDSGG